MPCQPGVRPPALIVTRTSVALGPPRSVSLPMGSPLPPTIGASAVWTDAGCAKAGVQTAVANRAAEASAFIISFLQLPSSLKAKRLSCEGPPEGLPRVAASRRPWHEHRDSPRV